MDDLQISPIEPPRTRRRPVLLLTAAALIALLATGFIRWGSPRLEQAGPAVPGAGTTRVDEGAGRERMVVDGRPSAPVTATFGIRNNGRVPVTVHGLDVSRGAGWLQRQHATFRTGAPGSGARPAPAARVTVQPGAEATVEWSLDMTCRPQFMGSGWSLRQLRFRVSRLGLDTVLEMPLDTPVTFTGEVTPPPASGCDAAEI